MTAPPDNDTASIAACAAAPQQGRRRLAAVIVFTTALRLLLLPLLRHAPFASDANDYIFMAHQFLAGDKFLPYSPPGMPAYIAVFAALSPNPLVLRAAMLLFWLIACWALWRLMRDLRMEACAWVVLLVWGLLPDTIYMSLEPLTQIAMAAMLLVAVSATVSLLRGRSWLDAVLLGASLGAAALMRPSALVLILALPVIAVWRSRRWTAALASAVVAFAMVGAWMLHVKDTTGHALINTSNAKNLYYGNNPWTPNYKTWYFGSHAKFADAAQFPEYQHIVDQVESLPTLQASARFDALARQEVVSHPILFLWRTSNRIRCFWGFDTFAGSQAYGHRWMHLPLAPLILLVEAALYLLLFLPAVYWLARSGSVFWRQPETIALTSATLLYAIPYWLSMSHPTYHFPVLALVAVLGATAWRNRAQARSAARGYAAVAVAVLVQLEWVWQMSRHIP